MRIEAINTRRVRGALALGAVGAYGVTLAAEPSLERTEKAISLVQDKIPVTLICDLMYAT